MNLKELQTNVAEFTAEKKLNTSITTRTLDLVSEVGELSKEVLKGTDYGSSSFQCTTGWKGEIGDVLFSLICIANESEVDLEMCLKQVLAKYEMRFNTNGSLGSGE